MCANVDSIRKLILSETHDTAYSIHPGSTKMYYDLKERFWWYGMKRAVAEYVAICDTCQRVKAEHQRPAGAKLAELYISRIVCLHGVPKRIISDRDSQFTSRFWEQLHNSLDTKLRFGTAYHPQTDRQTERTNQILEDMLRACAIHYQASLNKSPFEALYGQRCRTPLFWNQIGEKQVFVPDIIQDAEQQLQIVQENLRRSYTDVRRRDLSFKVDDHVYLKEKKDEVAYRLELPPSLSGVHDVFHVSQLKKCLTVPEEQAPLEGLEVQEDLIYTEHPVKILDTSERNTRNKRIKMCCVQWSHHTEAEATWERENECLFFTKVLKNRKEKKRKGPAGPARPAAQPPGPLPLRAPAWAELTGPAAPLSPLPPSLTVGPGRQGLLLLLPEPPPVSLCRWTEPPPGRSLLSPLVASLCASGPAPPPFPRAWPCRRTARRGPDSGASRRSPSRHLRFESYLTRFRLRRPIKGSPEPPLHSFSSYTQRPSPSATIAGEFPPSRPKEHLEPIPRVLGKSSHLLPASPRSP
ncbi:LOW QUALITY PROTEIN: hypothetical protein U9M48_019143 [Paspalum notatum var. saurae]|uniref:Integrase catalytic domain-containing protein n=1 Tax=Paspalum notatum var. saurae TaxID=547442 RepID=A0AAQ3TBL1_PASNO